MKFAWIDERPFNYLSGPRDAPVLVGCDASLARAAFGRLGVDFEPVKTTFAELLPGLARGRWDVTTGMFLTPERRKRADFTRPIWSLGDGILIPASARSTVDGYRSLAASGARIAVLRDQVQITNALANGFTWRDIVLYEDYGTAAAAVSHGEVGGYASVELAHREYLAANADTNVTVVAVPTEETAPSCGAFACSSRHISDRMDIVLNEILGDGDPAEPSADPSSWPT